VEYINYFLFFSKVQEWYKRSERFSVLCKNVLTLAKKIAICANKELCYDLFSYIWDVTGVVSLMNAFIKWLALGHFPPNINSYTQGSYTCKSTKIPYNLL